MSENSKVKKMLDDISKYDDGLTLEDNIRDRLEKTFNLYMEELASASERLLSKKPISVYKGFSD